jgi:drug/metabolite transporter (DMT)-like permease
MENKNWKGHGALFAAYLIFGLNTPISKFVLEQGAVSSLALTFYRMAGAALLFWALSLCTKKERVQPRDLLTLCLAGLLGIFVNNLAFIVGLGLTSPIDASVITTLVPIMTMALAAVLLKEPVTWIKVTGVVVGAAGALLLIFQGTAGGSASGTTGNLLCIVSSVSFAVYLTAFRNLIARYRVVTLMKWMFLFSAVCCVPFCWQDVGAVDYARLPASTWLGIAYVIVLATFVVFFCIPTGQKLLRPTVVSMYNYLQPLVSSLVAVALGMDAFGWTKGAAGLLIFLGVYLVTQKK